MHICIHAHTHIYMCIYMYTCGLHLYVSFKNMAANSSIQIPINKSGLWPLSLDLGGLEAALNCSTVEAMLCDFWGLATTHMLFLLCSLKQSRVEPWATMKEICSETAILWGSPSYTKRPGIGILAVSAEPSLWIIPAQAPDMWVAMPSDDSTPEGLGSLSFWRFFQWRCQASCSTDRVCGCGVVLYH